MNSNKSLKERVLYFVSQQPGYRSHEGENITVTNKNNGYSILFGNSVEVGIVGAGATEDEAFDDFIKKWNSFKGFEWIDKSKLITGI